MRCFLGICSSSSFSLLLIGCVCGSFGSQLDASGGDGGRCLLALGLEPRCSVGALPTASLRLGLCDHRSDVFPTAAPTATRSAE